MTDHDISMGITGFIDILGFSNAIANAESLNNIIEAQDKIKNVQKYFEFEPANINTKKNHQIHKKTVIAISDSIIFHLPLKSDATRINGTLDPILAQISNLAISQSRCIFNSIFVRGGIDIGWWYNKKSIVMGNALVHAVKREATAVVPVIALCDKIYEYLSHHTDRTAYHSSVDPITRLFREYNSGAERFFYIDYIGICLEHLDDGESWLEEHARIIEKSANTAPTNQAYRKYQWLSVYHNEIAHEATTNEQCYCNL